jgi:hypothetical protein
MEFISGSEANTVTTEKAATPRPKPTTSFVVCVDNDGYAASLEARKIYRVIPDARAAAHRMLRIVDESGEDYLYPVDRFVTVRLPRAAQEAFSAAV